MHKDDLMSLMPGDIVINLIELTGDRGHRAPAKTKFKVMATDGNECVLVKENAKNISSSELFFSHTRQLKVTKEVEQIRVENLGEKYEIG